jgi:hypothetical protein
MWQLARRAVLLNVNEPETRGVALALQTVLDDLGKGLGPLLVSLMVSAWGACVPLPLVLAFLFACCCGFLPRSTKQFVLPCCQPWARSWFPVYSQQCSASESAQVKARLPLRQLRFSGSQSFCCRQAAFNVAIAGWIPCGAIFAICALFLAKEEDGLQVCSLYSPAA